MDQRWNLWIPHITNAVIAIATVVNAAVAFYLWKATIASVDLARTAFETTNRPYVGIAGASVQKLPERKALVYTVAIKNFGTIPATGLKTTLNVLVNKTAIPLSGVPEEPTTLFPGSFFYKTGPIRDAQYDAVISGVAAFEVIVNASYKGPTGRLYTYCSKYWYQWNTNRFFDVGNCAGMP